MNIVAPKSIVVAFLLSVSPAFAQVGTVGASVSPTTMDPQLSTQTSDVGWYRHIYDPLFRVNNNGQVVPGLATAISAVDDKTWEVKLRNGVKFHDGSDFTADDVVFTLSRLGTVPGHDGLAAQYMSPIVKSTIVDPHTIRFTTSHPTPDLAKRFAQISIISNELPADVATEQFNSGKAAIGTGPYKFVQWRRGDNLVLERNADYWGGSPAFEGLTVRTMSNAATRVAALEAGDVDMIDNVPPLDARRLTGSSDLKVATTNSGRAHFLQFDSTSERAAATTAADGSALDRNPFADRRVREALNVAISRQLLVERVMDGFAKEVNQGVPEPFEGYDPKIGTVAYDPGRAKALLAEAGFPDGFAFTLGCPNDRYVNDVQVCQAIGQMWSRIGVRVNVDTTPRSVYFPRMYDLQYPVHLLAWGNTAGDSISFLQSVVGSPNKAAGRGSNNRSYSNPSLDARIDDAASTIDDAERRRKLQDVMRTAVEDVSFIPLYTTSVIAATRAGLTYAPQANEMTDLLLLKPQP